MISKTGENLDVVILTRTAEDWRAFACWYSVTKNLPEARVFLICNRTTKVEFQYYQWAKRLNLPHVYTNPFCNEPIGDLLGNINTAKIHGFGNETTLFLNYSTMVVGTLDEKWHSLINDPEPLLVIDEYVSLSRHIEKKILESIINKFLFTGKFEGLPVLSQNLCPEAKFTTESECIVGTDKGCGRWIDTMKGCPFSNADGLLVDDMTVNELRIMNLWRKMVALYSAVN